MEKRGEVAVILMIALVASVGAFVLFMHPQTTGLAAAQQPRAQIDSPCLVLAKDVNTGLNYLSAKSCDMGYYLSVVADINCPGWPKIGYMYIMINKPGCNNALNKIRTSYSKLKDLAASDKKCTTIFNALRDQFCKNSPFA